LELGGEIPIYFGPWNVESFFYRINDKEEFLLSIISMIAVKSISDQRNVDVHLLERDMTIEECRIMCNSRKIQLREKLFFRMIYETLLQPSEVLNLQIENWDRKYAVVKATRVMMRTRPLEGDMSKKVWLQMRPKTRSISSNTDKMLIKYVKNRKKGPIFVSNQTGEMISLTWFNKAINRYATLLGIQKIKKYFKDEIQRDKPRNLKLVTLMALKRAGERDQKIKR
jgi:integrase